MLFEYQIQGVNVRHSDKNVISHPYQVFKQHLAKRSLAEILLESIFLFVEAMNSKFCLHSETPII